MVAMETGWTPDVLAELPDPFRRACHWTVYVEAIAGSEGFPSTEIPKDVPQSARLEAMKQSAKIAHLRSLVFPEDDGG